MKKSRLIFWVVLVFTLTACRSNGTIPTPTAPPPPIPTAISTPASNPTVPPPSQTPTTAPSPTPTRPAADFSSPAMVVVANNLPAPDDLLATPDGSLYISDVSDGTIRRVAPDGSIQVILSGLSDPEGMVALPDGSLIIAEQGKNRLVRWDPTTRKIEALLALENKSGGLGVDGLALDARPGHTPTLIIPDSPNNRVLRASLDGRQVTEIARGLSRPTGAWVEPDGSLLVVEENGAALVRIHLDGRLEKLAGGLPTPDDVVEDADGNIFVVTLGDNALHWLSPSGQDQILAKGFSSPQGLALDASGNPIVADQGNHRVVRVLIHR